MKKIVCLFIGVFTCVQLFAQGVGFKSISLKEALEQAKAQGKMVFVDCYTTWCGPCKMMAEQVFPQKAAGDFFNARFVNVKFDMEKGEGKEFYLHVLKLGHTRHFYFWNRTGKRDTVLLVVENSKNLLSGLVEDYKRKILYPCWIKSTRLVKCQKEECLI